jgi:hypothetical protein
MKPLKFKYFRIALGQELLGGNSEVLHKPKWKTRPAIFKWRQTEPGLILCAVRWYLRYSLSLRNVEDLLRSVVAVSITQRNGAGVQCCRPELEQ